MARTAGTVRPRLAGPRKRPLPPGEEAPQPPPTEAAADSTSVKAANSPQEIPVKKSARLENIRKRKERSDARNAALHGLTQERSAPRSRPTRSAADPSGPDYNLDDDDESSEASGPDDIVRRAKRARKGTPDTASTHAIKPDEVTMWQLAARHRKFGKVSEREEKMRKINWKEVKARRRAEMAALAYGRDKKKDADEEEDPDEGQQEGETIDQHLERMAEKHKGKRKGIQIKVVDGQHVVDVQSQKVDRHALANEDVDKLEEVDGDDLTMRFNAHTYSNLRRRDPEERIPTKDRWRADDTEKFYECLRRFGSDFMIISKMFPGRTRRHIKTKYLKEERENLERVNEALKGRPRDADDAEEQSWDFSFFQEASGYASEIFRDPKQVEEELKERRLEREKEIAKQQEETRELKHQRRLAGVVSSDEEDDEEEEQDATGGTRAPRDKGKETTKASVDAAEPETVMETIEISDGVVSDAYDTD